MSISQHPNQHEIAWKRGEQEIFIMATDRSVSDGMENGSASPAEPAGASTRNTTGTGGFHKLRRQTREDFANMCGQKLN